MLEVARGKDGKAVLAAGRTGKTIPGAGRGSCESHRASKSVDPIDENVSKYAGTTAVSSVADRKPRRVFPQRESESAVGATRIPARS